MKEVVIGKKNPVLWCREVRLAARPVSPHWFVGEVQFVDDLDGVEVLAQAQASTPGEAISRAVQNFTLNDSQLQGVSK